VLDGVNEARFRDDGGVNLLQEIRDLDSWQIVFWAALAALAFVGELLTVSLFLLFFSFGAVVGLLAALFGFGIAVQAVGFVAASVLSMAILRPTFLKRLSLGGGERYRRHRGITGESAVVTEEIEAGGKGMVRVGSGEFWTARSLHPDEKLEEGTRVRVLDTDGLTALVDPFEKEEKS
jgi:membrane protein implicated in regulation of membrane protease activity